MKKMTSPLLRHFILFSLLITATLFLPISSPANTISSAQQILQQMGYYDGAVDGTMGSRTSAAIRRFQVANKIRPTGTLTPETLNKLALTPSSSSSSSPSRGVSVQQPQPEAIPAYYDPKALADIFVGGPLLSASPEIQVATVQRAQSNLTTLGYYHGSINGYPDANLKEALKAYQKDSRFKRTGHLDKITLMGLNILPGQYQPGR